MDQNTNEPLVPQVFDYHGHQVRTVLRDGVPWWVAQDICEALELSNPSEATSGLDEDEKMTISNPESHSGQRGGARSLVIVNESGLYELTWKSRKPAAKAFKVWIKREVIPAIRKTGSYVAPGAQAPGMANTMEIVREVVLLLAPIIQQGQSQAVQQINQHTAQLLDPVSEAVNTNFRPRHPGKKVKDRIIEAIKASSDGRCPLCQSKHELVVVDGGKSKTSQWLRWFGIQRVFVHEVILACATCAEKFKRSLLLKDEWMPTFLEFHKRREKLEKIEIHPQLEFLFRLDKPTGENGDGSAATN